MYAYRAENVERAQQGRDDRRQTFSGKSVMRNDQPNTSSGAWTGGCGKQSNKPRQVAPLPVQPASRMGGGAALIGNALVSVYRRYE